MTFYRWRIFRTLRSSVRVAVYLLYFCFRRRVEWCWWLFWFRILWSWVLICPFDIETGRRVIFWGGTSNLVRWGRSLCWIVLWGSFRSCLRCRIWRIRVLRRGRFFWVRGFVGVILGFLVVGVWFGICSFLRCFIWWCGFCGGGAGGRGIAGGFWG